MNEKHGLQLKYVYFRHAIFVTSIVKYNVIESKR